MRELFDWYWRYGVLRGQDQNDPDRELRRISLGWLDNVMQIVDRDAAIRKSASDRACLALWGPSQTGKSTLMSRYVDGIMDDGSDSALTWDDAHKTRFSPPGSGVDMLRVTSPDTLIFNPFNYGSDASGIATRYTMRDDGEVDRNFPVEVVFTTRSQIIQSIAFGYQSECESSKGEKIYFRQEDFLRLISRYDDEVAETATPNPDAYLYLKDIANVLEFMRHTERFSNLFVNEAWTRKIRARLVSSRALSSNISFAKQFLAEIFWDGDVRLTGFYDQLIQMLGTLTKEWGARKVIASMEVGSLLLDIDSYNSFVNPTAEMGLRVRDAVSRLSYTVRDDVVEIGIGAPSSISGASFGVFQAICGEIIVPLRKQVLAAASGKEAFFELAQQCDILDFPGVNNRNRGINVTAETAELVDLKSVTEQELFTTVFKQGKTQCFVYNYVRQYGIDAFAILIRTLKHPSNTGMLNEGVGEWLRSYDKDWKPGTHAQMPVFVDMTFFSKLLNEVRQSGVGTGFTGAIDMLKDLKPFATTRTARFFATTYRQFDEGEIKLSDETRESVIRQILDERSFSEYTGLGQEGLEAVYEQDGGLEYMFREISRAISVERRRARCTDILAEDLASLLRQLVAHLPSDKDASLDRTKAVLASCHTAVDKALERIEREEDPNGYVRLVNEMQTMFSAEDVLFDRIPMSIESWPAKKLSDFSKAQVNRWFERKLGQQGVPEFFSEEQHRETLKALRDTFDIQKFNEVLREYFGDVAIPETRETARYLLSLVFMRLLQFGDYKGIPSGMSAGETEPSRLDVYITAECKKDVRREGSPYYETIIKPIAARFEKLSTCAKAGERPPQPGDDELKKIYDALSKLGG